MLKFDSPGAGDFRCVQPPGKVSFGKRLHVDSSCLISTGTTVSQIVTGLHFALCFMRMGILHNYSNLGYDTRMTLAGLPHLHIMVVALIGLMEINSINCAEPGSVDAISVRFLSLLAGSAGLLAGEYCLESGHEAGAFVLHVLIVHRFLERTMCRIRKVNTCDTPARVQFKVFFTRFCSIAAASTCYFFVLGGFFATGAYLEHALLDLVLIFVASVIYEMSLCWLLYQSLLRQDDTGTLAALLLMANGHILAYSRFVSSSGYLYEQEVAASTLQYLAQYLLCYNVMNFKDKIYYSKIQ